MLLISAPDKEDTSIFRNGARGYTLLCDAPLFALAPPYMMREITPIMRDEGSDSLRLFWLPAQRTLKYHSSPRFRRGALRMLHYAIVSSTLFLKKINDK